MVAAEINVFLNCIIKLKRVAIHWCTGRGRPLPQLIVVKGEKTRVFLIKNQMRNHRKLPDSITRENPRSHWDKRELNSTKLVLFQSFLIKIYG